MNADVTTALSKFAWPAVVLLVALAYKTELTGVVPRILRHVRAAKVEAFGVKSEMTFAEQQAQTEEIQLDKGLSTATSNLVRTPAIIDLEKTISEELGTNDPIEIKSKLIYQTAVSRLDAHFSRSYGPIFGSQIKTIMEISARRKVSGEFIAEIYSQAEKDNVQFYSNYSYIKWLDYLFATRFIKRSVEDPSFLEITSLGDEFLRWMKVMNMSENKMG